MSKPIDYQLRFVFSLVCMFLMLGFLFIEIVDHNVFWSIWCLGFATWDAVWAKVSYDNWR